MLKVLKSGFYTTVQDAGRFGLRHKGVPISGAMDMTAMNRVNSLLENEPEAAVLEITMTGPTLTFEENTYICIGGAEMSATLNNEPIENYTLYTITEGDIISFGKLEQGFRAYLAIKGGFLTDKVLGSRSQYYPLTSMKRLKDHDEIPFEAASNFEIKISELRVDSHFDEQTLIVERGPEYDMLTDSQLTSIFSKDFSISKENNRMAYQIAEYIDGHSTNMLTSATLPGTVQLTPAGKLIILMKDGQTTGGYPRILKLTEEAICILAQKKFGDMVNFKLI
ncbi:MAG: biotin-dependent carboxyltransferase family protein [Croceitalea sp.]|nr:biotin-dependent carboxyltransferase family protein [Croceitalea sp.]NNM19045.1 biotin-dependent carboxyltransferase family protein [Croceitalea sp.]